MGQQTRGEALVQVAAGEELLDGPGDDGSPEAVAPLMALVEDALEPFVVAVEQVAQQTPKLRDWARAVEARGAWAKDTSMLYGQIMSLAKEHDVQVRDLRPGEQKLGRDKTVVVTRIDMTAEAEYEQIAEFLGALDEIGASLRPISVQLAPTKRTDGSYAVVQLGSEALEFRLPKVVSEMARRSNERP